MVNGYIPLALSKISDRFEKVYVKSHFLLNLHHPDKQTPHNQ